MFLKSEPKPSPLALTFFSCLMALWHCTAGPASASRGLTPLPATESSNSVSSPRIFVPEIQHDFGRVTGGETGRWVFAFANIGSRTLKVSALKAECSCLECLDWTRELEPGTAGSIPVLFYTRDYSGPVAKNLTIVSDDPDQPQAILQVRATVWRAIDTFPSSAVFDLPTKQTPNSKVIVRLVNNEEAFLRIEKLKWQHKEISVEVKALKDGREFQLSVSAQPMAYRGNLFDRIEIRTSSLTTPLLEIPVFGMLREPADGSTSGGVAPKAPLGK